MMVSNLRVWLFHSVHIRLQECKHEADFHARKAHGCRIFTNPRRLRQSEEDDAYERT